VTISGTLLTIQLDVSTGRFPVLFKSIYRTKDTSLYRIILELQLYTNYQELPALINNTNTLFVESFHETIVTFH